MLVKAVLFWVFCGGLALAQGFAGLGQGGDGFARPMPGYAFDFPSDHGAHPDYRIEWWYLTATLQDDMGTEYGVQWTLFRSALGPEGPQVWMGHAGLTTPKAHHSGERFARDGIGQAGVIAAPFEAWIDDWSMAGDDLDTLRVKARMPDASYDLTLRATGPLVFHGDRGYSVKSASGQASYYYSQPFYEVSGTLNLPGGAVAVTGSGWLDREWSSQPLEEDQQGWDWFSLHFDSGARLMAFGLRGQGDDFTYASWIDPDGTLTPYDRVAMVPLDHANVAGRSVPIAWRVQLEQKDLDVEVRAVNPQSWQDTLFPYWEGPVIAKGSHSGKGYLEMTGY